MFILLIYLLYLFIYKQYKGAYLCTPLTKPKDSGVCWTALCFALWLGISGQGHTELTEHGFVTLQKLEKSRL